MQQDQPGSHSPEQAPQQAPADTARNGHGAPAGTPEQAPSIDSQLASMEAKAADLEDAYLRARADLENLRRRAQEDITRAHKFAIESFAEALLPVKDSLETALKVDTPSVESLKQGVDMTLRQLDSAFEKNRLAEINPQPGDKLDPMRHQAISMVPDGQEANAIISVLQKGYTISDRLLRPALVTVSQGKANPGD
jgi:molecular chaperone GrpE